MDLWWQDDSSGRQRWLIAQSKDLRWTTAVAGDSPTTVRFVKANMLLKVRNNTIASFFVTHVRRQN